LQWPDYDNPETLLPAPVDQHLPPFDSTRSRSGTPLPQASTSQRTKPGPLYNGRATMRVPVTTSTRQVSLDSMARASELLSEPATSPQQREASAAPTEVDISSPEASASELREGALIRERLMAALRDAGYDEMSHHDREELLISTCLAQHRGAKRRMLQLQRNSETAAKETNAAHEAERRANALVQHLQLEVSGACLANKRARHGSLMLGYLSSQMQRKQEEADARRSTLERQNAELQTELQQLRAHVQRIDMHAMHGDYLRRGPESGENSQETFGGDSTDQSTPQQQLQQLQPSQPQRYGTQQMLSPHDLGPRSALAAESSPSEAMRGLEPVPRPSAQQRSLSLQTGRDMQALYGASASGASHVEPLPQLAELAFQELMNASSRANDDMEMQHSPTTPVGAQGDTASQIGAQHQHSQQFQHFQQQQQQLSAEHGSLGGTIASLINGTSESHVRTEANDMQT
jgi:hypothetical protein